ncbi:MAG TPA: hypothetical protein VF897_09440 [Roseiflexaceae bacterium]
MNTPRKLTKARLIQIEWKKQGAKGEPVPGGKEVTVQFNPASLKVTYANQVQTNDQSNNASTQYVGKGSSKLSLELIFDVSMPLGQDSEANAPPRPAPDDVRKLTEEIAFFMQAKPEGSDDKKFVPPGARLVWGSFLFEGIVESMDETLDLWSEDGRPLRATVALGMSQQGIVFEFNDNATQPPAGGARPGTRPLQPARKGDSVQNMASRAGRPKEWKQIAQSNGIENPRNLPPGTLVDTQPRGRRSR